MSTYGRIGHGWGAGVRENNANHSDGESASTMELTDVLTTVRGEPITVRDVVAWLKVNGTFRNAIYQLISQALIADKARELGVKVTPAQLRVYAMRRRESLGVADAVSMNNYCRWLGITFEQWEREVEKELLRERVKAALFPRSVVDRLYEERSHELHVLTLSRIVCREKSRAQHARRRLADNKSQFSEVARQYSEEEETREMGGYLGQVRWGMLPPDVEQAVFGAESGALLGPLQQDSFWVLYHIDDVQRTELTDELREQIADRLFSDWLEEAVRDAEA